MSHFSSQFILISMVLVIHCSCAVNPADFAREKLSPEGFEVRLSQNKTYLSKCQLIKAISTKLYIEPPPLFEPKEKVRAEDRPNYKDMIERLRNRAGEARGNVIGDIDVKNDVSNWDRSVQVEANAYRCNP